MNETDLSIVDPIFGGWPPIVKAWHKIDQKAVFYHRVHGSEIVDRYSKDCFDYCRVLGVMVRNGVLIPWRVDFKESCLEAMLEFTRGGAAPTTEKGRELWAERTPWRQCDALLWLYKPGFPK